MDTAWVLLNTQIFHDSFAELHGEALASLVAAMAQVHELLPLLWSIGPEMYGVDVGAVEGALKLHRCYRRRILPAT